ncbi:hypothetical protein RhiTH_000005 [Rhizoctonia solani]
MGKHTTVRKSTGGKAPQEQLPPIIYSDEEDDKPTAFLTPNGSSSVSKGLTSGKKPKLSNDHQVIKTTK